MRVKEFKFEIELNGTKKKVTRTATHLQGAIRQLYQEMSGDLRIVRILQD